MDHWWRSNGAFAALGSFADRQFTEVAAPFHSKRQGSGAMTPRLLSFWLAVLLGSVAIDQSKADGGLAPQNRERSVQIPQLSAYRCPPRRNSSKTWSVSDPGPTHCSVSSPQLGWSSRQLAPKRSKLRR